MGNKYNFNKLAPKKDIAIDVYNEAFDFIFENDDILNVALTGPYSAGKSTVFLSYENSDKGKDKNYLHISLANFTCATKKADNGNDKESSAENNLEGRIINQLLYQIDSNDIPDSKFKIKIRKEYDPFFIGIILLLLIFGLFINIFHDFLLKWDSELYYLPIQSACTIIVNPYIRIISLIISISIILYFIVNTISEKKLLSLVHKISIFDASLELFPKENDSIFDKYKDEIIYILENSKADVIVFEDIDRFDSIEIFERLREINWLLNVRINKLETRRNNIRFFYLIKDEMFTSTDRTKFFDFIIPIVPVMSGTNAYDIMLEHLKNNNFIKNIDKDFLKGLCVFIDEKRLLDNIYNEFLIYAEKLKEGPLDYNKLLALIAYKNTFPKDFNKLYKNIGFIADIFKCKEKIVAAIDKRIDKKIEDTQNKIIEETSKKEDYEQEGELYICNQIIDSLNYDIRVLQQKKSELSSRNLSEIIEMDNTLFWEVVSIVKVNDFDENSSFIEKYCEIFNDDKFPFVQYLLREGKIDENNKYLMNVFYGKYISSNDLEFINSTYDANSKEYDYKLDSPETVSKQLELKRFDRNEILNFSLLEYLLKSNVKNRNKLNTFIRTIQRENNLGFLEEFFRKTNQKETLVKSINDIWPDFFDMILKSWSEQNILDYSLLVLKTLDKKNLAKIVNHTKLKDYISEHPTYLLYITDSKKQIEAMKLIGVCLKNILNKKYKKGVVQEVYSNNLYVLNMQNIRIMLSQIEKQPQSNYDKGQVLSCVFSLKDRTIYKYVNANLGGVIQNLLDVNYSFKDNDSTIETILNSDEIDDEIKQGYINNLSSKLTLLEKINSSDLRHELIMNNCVSYLPENVFVYFLDFGWDNRLEQFINSDNRRRMKLRGYEKYIENLLVDDRVANGTHYKTPKEVYSAIFKNIVFSNGLSLKKYDCLLNNLNWHYNEIPNLNSINDERIEILIKNGCISFNEKNLLSIRNNAPKNLEAYIKVYMKEYITAVKNREINCDEMQMILSFTDKTLREEEKLELLLYCSDSLRIKDEYSAKIKSYIIKNNFDNRDLSYIFARYSEFDANTQEVILEKAINNINVLISKKDSIDGKLLEDLVCSSKLTRSYKVMLFKNNINRIDTDCIHKFLEVLDFNSIASQFTARREHIPLNESNEDMVRFLKQSKIIKRYVIDEEKGVIKGIQIYK